MVFQNKYAGIIRKHINQTSNPMLLDNMRSGRFPTIPSAVFVKAIRRPCIMGGLQNLGLTVILGQDFSNALFRWLRHIMPSTSLLGRRL